MDNKNIGDMAWLDLTVDNAEQVKSFYQDVIGWSVDACSMGDYDDYVMNNANGEAQAGVCHSKGVNADLPPAWIPYFLVMDIDASVANVIAKGGSMVTEVKLMGDDKYAVIKDPAGAVCALYCKKSNK